MFSRLKKTIGRMARAILPYSWVRVLRRPALLPGDYRPVIRRAEYVKSLQAAPDALDDDYHAQQLRMYCHILDKGLQQCNVEPGHGTDIYRLARESLDKVRSPELVNDPSVAWARRKLAEYEHLQSGQLPQRQPHGPVEGEASCEALLRTMKARRSIRSYEKKHVTMDVIEKIAEVFNWSPWSCHRQTGKIFVVNDPDLAGTCLKTCRGGTGFSAFVPCFLSFCADLRSYVMPREIWVPMVDVGLGTQNCALMAHALGLSMTCLSWAQHNDREETELRRLLEIPEHFEIVVNAVLGYPEYAVDIPSRKSVKLTYVLRSVASAETNLAGGSFA